LPQTRIAFFSDAVMAIALYWNAHHLCFMPFPTGLLFSNPSRIASVTLYAGTAAGMGLSLAWLWLYAVRHRFIAPGLPRPVIRDIRLNLVLPPLIFLLSIGVAFLDPSVAMYAWLLLIPVYVFRRLRERSLVLED
jgi:uncharacterized membrane protein